MGYPLIRLQCRQYSSIASRLNDVISSAPTCDNFSRDHEIDHRVREDDSVANTDVLSLADVDLINGCCFAEVLVFSLRLWRLSVTMV